MTSTLKHDTQKHVVTYGNYALAAPGQPLFTKVGKRLVYNVLPGQGVAYTVDSQGVTNTEDHTSLSAADIYRLYFGVGVDLNGDGLTDDIRHIGIEHISGCNFSEVAASSPHCGAPEVWDFYFDCTRCDETYSLMVRVDDNLSRSFAPWNKSALEFVGSIVTQCASCNDCAPEHNCREVACKLSDALNADFELKVGSDAYPDWKGNGLPQPFFVTRLHPTSKIYCFAPQTPTVVVGEEEIETGCERCTFYDAIDAVRIRDTVYPFVGNTNPLDATQTLKGQLGGIVEQINEFFKTEYGENAHAGSAYLTGSYGECCPIQVYVNTCDATFALIDANGAEIEPTTTENPFTVHGTFQNPANCVDCGDLAVAAQGLLTFIENADNGDTVQIGAKTYTLQTVLTDVDGNVAIGASASATIDNLVAAINLGPGAGTAYAASMTIHPTVTAMADAGDTLRVTAKTAGTAGNAIATVYTNADDGTNAFAAATLLGGLDAAAGVPTSYTCGVRLILERIAGDCSCFLEKPLSFYGRKGEIVPFGDGWKGKSFRIVQVSQMELPAGFGSWIQWLEYQTLPEGRGRRFSRSNSNKGWLNLPDKKSRVNNAVTARCDRDYCSYYLKSDLPKNSLDNRPGFLTINSNVHIPTIDTTTITAFENFLDALIALVPTCKVINTVACNIETPACP